MTSVSSSDVLLASKSDGEDARAFGARIRQCRTAASYTLQETADRAGVSKSLLSQVERGTAQPSLVTLRRLAQVLGVSVAAFFAEGGDTDDPRRDRAGTRMVIRQEDRVSIVVPGAARWQLLVPSLDNNLAVLYGELDPGTVVPGAWQASTHDGEECVLCLEGELTYVSMGRSFVLHPGDSITFVTSHSEQMMNAGSTVTRFIASICR